ncbi:MAG: class F sortase [Chloroflexi bacterium]|nr:MAG: class F sortase [Chloroflexota bacterium]
MRTNFRLIVSMLIISIFMVVPVVEAQSGPQQGASLTLPTVGVETSIVTAPLTSTTWDVSQLGEQVGHLEGTSWLNTPGNIVLGGHSEDIYGNPAVFSALYDLELGDPVVMSENGVIRRYIVTEIQFVAFDDLRPIYPTTHEQVTLLTCAVGTFNQSINNYDERLVVIARPVPPLPAPIRELFIDFGWLPEA